MNCDAFQLNRMTTCLRHGRRRAAMMLGVIVCVGNLACVTSNQIDIELRGNQPTLYIDAPIWTWNFRPVRINALAVANDNEALWEIRTATPDGVPAAGLEIHYGEVPEDFEQISPPNNGRAKDLAQGETYYVGATGPNDETWRAVFALPVSRFGAPPKQTDEPTSQPAKIDVSQPQPGARIAE